MSANKIVTTASRSGVAWRRPPSVVVKDYTWNGSAGYLAASGSTEKRFRTIIQIVPPTTVR